MLRRSSSSATSLFCASRTISCSRRVGSRSAFMSAKRSRTFWRWVASICGTSSRRVTTSSSIEVRRSLIRRASSAPSRSRPALSSFKPWVNRARASALRACGSVASATSTPGQASTSSGLRAAGCLIRPAMVSAAATSCAARSRSICKALPVVSSVKRRVHSSLPREMPWRSASRTAPSRSRNDSGRRRCGSR